ncbi:MAG: hydantoinase/oxoprolinase family protein [Paracoccaceae bacterium]|nr:hydantoinase/oxoprolinase family protein [Paracoccaceae bacterium]MDE2911679.1 hydantoinase/oxoprolinase family protein [Paracoccaceae bacterium]
MTNTKPTGWRVGVDSGGTFTDICLYDERTGRTDVWKTASTPDDPSRGIFDAMTEVLERVGVRMSDLSYFGHGTTVATNALIELEGARTGLITTDGFRDLLEIGRQKRPSLYDMMADKPKSLVPRDRRIEVPERLRSDGSIEYHLNVESVRVAARKLVDKGVDAVAVCFLYSFLDSSHERAAAAVLADEIDEAFITVSSDVAPEFREFERLSTTVVNAFLGPVMKRFVTRLDARLREAGIPVPVHLTQSNGGVIGVETAAAHPVRTLLSGPSTGVVAAQEIARRAGFGNVITLDAGGTSSDVALLENGVCKRSAEGEVHGYPIKLPMLDIHTVGAGGGSIAWVDSGGLLKVGPQSSGALPGPACYGRGGKEPTVTDANVVLRTLNPVSILGGRMRIERDRAAAAVSGLAESLGMGLNQTAQGIISVATANMARAIRVISVQKGHDPRDYTLMAFGGAGPLHAARLARELEVSRIVVPPAPGALCALGLLVTDLKADFSQTRRASLSPDAASDLSDIFDVLADRASRWLDRESIPSDRRMLIRTADMRYVGQNHELQVPVPGGPITAASIDRVADNFEAAHRQRFGFAVEGESIEFITLRIEALGHVNKMEPTRVLVREHAGSPQPQDRRNVWLSETGGTVDCPVYSRSDFLPGQTISGPAIVEQMDTTSLVLPEMLVQVDEWQNLIMEPA